jgi:branched-chain amino acid transport system substrate-binding protein
MRPVTRTTKWAGLLLLLILLATTLLSGCQQEKTLKIGLVTEQTGVDAYIGQASIPMLTDRIEEINANGGIGGMKLQLITYDTRSEITDAVAVTKRLIEQDRVVAVVGPSWSAAGIPMAEIADANKVPILASTASNVNVTVTQDGKLHPYMFRMCFIDPYQGFALANFAYDKLGLRKAAFLTDIASPYSVGIQNFFEDQFVKKGGEIVAKEGYQTGDSEFRAQLAKIKDSGADLVVVPSYTYKDAGLAAQQMEGLGLDIPLMGADGWFVDELLDMAGPQLEGSYLSTGVSVDAPEFADFNAKFVEKHNMQPNMFAYYNLDALYAIEWAAREIAAEGGEITSQALRDKLENMKDVPLFTSVVTMEPDTHNPHNKPLLIMTITDSQWKVVETFKPSD